MAVDYKSIEFRLHEYLVQIQEILMLLEADHKLLDNIIENKELIKSKKYNIAVMGEFKKGKSSLINALLGSNILPADVTPTTATINRITYGVRPTVLINYKNGNKTEIDILQLSDYVTKLSSDGENRALQIKEAVIFSPTVICQNHVDIIDTPGLNDDEQMTKITIDMLNNVDGVILAVSARTPFSDTEAKFVCQLIKNSAINTIIFTITFMDQLDEDEYDYKEFINSIKERISGKVLEQLEKSGEEEAVLKKARQIFENIHIYGISSKMALKSFILNDSRLLKASRFEEFKSELLKIVTAKQVENATQKTVSNIHAVLSQIDNQYQIGMQKLSAETQLFQHDSAEVYRYCNSCRKAVDNMFVKSNDELNAILNRTYSMKNRLVSEFIKNLSTIKNNTHNEIMATISSATFECYHIANNEYGTQIQKELYECFELSSKTFIEFRRSVLTNYLFPMNLENQIDLSVLINNILLFTRKSLFSVQFSWKTPTMPNVANLVNYNVIDTIINAVDVSINRYHDDFASCIINIRKHWFEQVLAEAEAIKNSVKQKENEVSNQIDTRMKTYTSNYQTLSKNAKEIAKGSELLLQEFYDTSVI